MDDSVSITVDNIRFCMLFDSVNTRFIIEEASYDIKKYYVLEYDEDRAERGLERFLHVT